MAGRGSRFRERGFDMPKPLNLLGNEPFFWWATESLRRCCELRSLVFVVLAEHVADHAIDQAILERYPQARLVILPETTAGALATAVAGCAAVSGQAWLVVNDCDHAFRADALADALRAPAATVAGLLCHFRATAPIYSYAAYDAAGRLERTVEKQPISDLAIAGAYAFRDRAVFLHYARLYTGACAYPELFMSGVYNTMLQAGELVRGVLLDEHVPFGTPEEAEMAATRIGKFASWRAEGPG